MREDIGLFRGKRLDNGEWVEGFLYYEKIGAYLISVFINENIHGDVWERHRVDPATVGEYCGLKDKNGARMWEGNIVAGMFRFGLPFNSVVSFQEGAFGLMWYGNDKAGNEVSWFGAFTSICNVEYEVIGDVADNPELLEV